MTDPGDTDSDYTCKRRLALSECRKEHAMVWVSVILGCKERAARRFLNKVETEGAEAACLHGNAGRRKYVKAFEAIQSFLVGRPRGAHVRVEPFRQYCAERGFDVPAGRTVLHWQRNALGIRLRRSLTRRGRRIRASRLAAAVQRAGHGGSDQ